MNGITKKFCFQERHAEMVRQKKNAQESNGNDANDETASSG